MTPIWVLGRSFTTKASFRQPIVRASVIRSPSAIASTAASEHSGDGTFQLQMTYLEAEDGKDVTFSYTGRRLTLRGIPSDADATVWQLLVDGKEKDVFNFLREDDQTLTLLNKDFEKNDSQLNYSLKRTE